MKFAKRMVVLTEEEYKKLKGRKKTDIYAKAVAYKQEMSRKMLKPQVKGNKIDGYFTPDNQTRVKTLIKELSSIGMKIQSNREITLPHGDTVDGSDIVALMKELFVGTRLSVNRPTGWRQFTEAVAQSGAPISMISKLQARRIIERLRDERMEWEEY